VPAEFPVCLLRLLRCPIDAGQLAILEPHGGPPTMAEGTAECTRCGQRYPVRGGVLCLLAGAPLHEESARERELRDSRAEAVLIGQRPEWQSAFADATELVPMLGALGPLTGAVILDMGCGTGRYTLPLASGGGTVIALDFSRSALTLLAGKLHPGAAVGLVQADATTLNLAPRSFDRVVSTLHSNLPTRDHRMACLRVAADALSDRGRFVFGTHYRGARDLLLGTPAAGFYRDSGIYRYRMRPGEVRRETKPFFGRVRVRRIQVSLPGVRRAAVARLAARIPGLNSFSELLLVAAERPRRDPEPNRVSQLSRLCARWTGRGAA